jgi:hypothetical protein
MIVKRGSKYLLLSRETGKVLGKHRTLADAKLQERAIRIAQHVRFLRPQKESR